MPWVPNRWLSIVRNAIAKLPAVGLTKHSTAEPKAADAPPSSAPGEAGGAGSGIATDAPASTGSRKRSRKGGRLPLGTDGEGASYALDFATGQITKTERTKARRRRPVFLAPDMIDREIIEMMIGGAGYGITRDEDGDLVIQTQIGSVLLLIDLETGVIRLVRAFDFLAEVPQERRYEVTQELNEITTLARFYATDDACLVADYHWSIAGGLSPLQLQHTVREYCWRVDRSLQRSGACDLLE